MRISTFLLLIIALIASINTYGQEIIKPIRPNFTSYFNGVQIDSCLNYIVNQKIGSDELIKINNSVLSDIYISKSIKFRILNPKTEAEADSIQIDINHNAIPIGGNLNMKSPIVYEHWATKRFSFSDSLMANKLFKRLKSELNTFEQKFPPYEANKADKSEIVYSLETGIDENLTTFQLHLSILRNKNLYIVNLSHRKIYEKQKCL